jgi:hypothetical protein
LITSFIASIKYFSNYLSSSLKLSAIGYKHAILRSITINYHLESRIFTITIIHLIDITTPLRVDHRDTTLALVIICQCFWADIICKHFRANIIRSSFRANSICWFLRENNLICVIQSLITNNLSAKSIACSDELIVPYYGLRPIALNNHDDDKRAIWLSVAGFIRLINLVQLVIVGIRTKLVRPSFRDFWVTLTRSETIIIITN